MAVATIGVTGCPVNVSYQFSGVTPFGGGMWIKFFGSDGYLHYDLAADRLFGLRRGDAEPRELEGSGRAAAAAGASEADFIDSIREGKPVRYTDFATGVDYMEFTEAVAQSAANGGTVRLPLMRPFNDDDE